MLNEYQIVAAVNDRITSVLKSAYPLYSKPWTVPFPAKPESITGDMIRTQHHKGLFSCRYLASEGSPTAENILVAVYIWATSADMETKLARAAKMALSSYSPGGTTPLQLHKDEPEVQENGVMVRVVSFVTQVPQSRTKDPAAEIAGLNL